MKFILLSAWIGSCILLSVIYIVASLSSFIPPAAFSFISLFGIAFPYILILISFCCVINFFIYRKLAFFLLVLLPLGYFNIADSFSFQAPGKWQLNKTPNTLRIITWNVQGFNNLFPLTSPVAEKRIKMLETIKNLKADVICIQEYKNVENGRISVSVRKELDSLGYKYNFCSNDRLYKSKRSVHVEGVAIYSKRPLIDSGRIKISGKEKTENLIYTDVMLNNKRLRLFTAHLVSFYLYTDTLQAQNSELNIYKITYNRKRTIQYKLRETEIAHQNEIIIIRNTIDKSPYPVVYCGDLNTTPASYNYRLLKKNLQDAFLIKGSGIGATFYKILPTLRIDVCFVDKKFQVVQCKAEQKKLSDHYPVITDIQWKE